MKKTKRERQTNTANMKKCPCGNVAELNQKLCGACRDKNSAPGLHLIGTRMYFVTSDGIIRNLSGD